MPRNPYRKTDPLIILALLIFFIYALAVLLIVLRII